ncbi:MAG: hypothetical protein H6Q75_981 [Firmicutes bacterium]|nr:hypothetical protein [Bacillota bacterium]
MMKLMKLYKLAKKLFNCQNLLGYRRVIVFIIRSLWHYREVQGLHDFFSDNLFRQDLITKYPPFFSQLTRQVFYKKSSTAERFALITQHFSILEDLFTKSALQQMYLGPGLLLWSEQYKEQTLAMDLAFSILEYREGLLTLGLKLDGAYIYHINFWLSFDEQHNLSMYIGALQGSPGGLNINKELTKHFFGYRPKNLIMTAARVIVQLLSVNKIYAVSNYGFYANNHFRRDRILKTSLDTFWTEIEGNLSLDRRFFNLPVIEHRKNIEEVVSHKRNLYRKRFAVLDKISADITSALVTFMENSTTARELAIGISKRIFHADVSL